MPGFNNQNQFYPPQPSTTQMDGGYGYGNRRYYDDDKKHALRRFETMMNSEDDPEMRNIMQEVLQRYESR